MDAVVSQILQLSKKSEWQALRKYLDQHLDVLKRASGGYKQALDTLDLHKHTLGACYILYGKAQNDKEKHSAVDASFLDVVEPFMVSAAVEQVRNYGADRFGVVCHRYAETCRQIKSPGRGIPHLLQALTILRPAADHLTPLHADFVCLCLLEKQYTLALRVLNDTIYEIKPQVTGVTPRDMMLYYYYGGMVYAALRKFPQAISFFEACITTPATTLNAIVVEAYKKYVLVCVLHRGKCPNPKHCPPAVGKTIKRYCSEYNELADKFEKKELDKLTDCINKHRNIFEDDRNWGLVCQVQKAYTRQAISRLTNTYDTLSLDDIAKNAGLQSGAAAEALIVEMVDQGQISARIDERNGMVTFTDAQPTDLYDRMLETMEKVKAMATRIEQLDESVQVSREYVQKSLQRDPGLRDELRGDAGGQKKKSFGGMVGALADAFKG
eukprot:TRINITY_DN914_c2_g1_i1.p1 TRINITY_DN914_c2_g1~~TRINITY_DN914_c2_g1_i1.p1  ORF type:complete len:439 (+),score=164.13 TRINITY_DN914_c2_g1_i1:80-1396(+)